MREKGLGGPMMDPVFVTSKTNLSQLSEELASRGVDVQCGANMTCLRHLLVPVV